MLRFTKMHGLGNDYVYVDCFNQPAPEDPAALAVRVADRHFGVGGDGLILICPSESADAQMRMFNADGSEAEMCGNGIRCVAKYVYDHGIVRKPTLKIDTGAGVLSLDLEIQGNVANRVRVDMGQPRLAPAEIPVELPPGVRAERIVDCNLDELAPLPGQQAWREACGLDPRVTCVSMGNPHAVLYCRDVAAVPLESVGPQLETHPAFPNRINVHFVQIHHRGEATMRTWERGSGATLACGTGASAVGVAGVLTGRTDRNVTLHLPGGDLDIQWHEQDNHVFMTGPATEVFTGELRD